MTESPPKGAITTNQEYADLVPPLSTEEYESLKESIKQNGLWVPIVVNNQGVILDGHHRFKACQELGIEEPKTTTREFKDKLEKLFVIDCNLRRRQLNDFQRIELALKSKKMLEEMAEQNSSVNLKQNQSDSPTSKHLELGDKGVSEEIGKRAGVSHETVRKVETLIHKAPERVQKRLRAGEMSISRAFEQYGCGGGSSRKKQTVVTVQQKQQHRQGQSKAQVAAAAEEEEQEIWQIDPHNYNILDLEKYDKPLLIRIARLQHQELELLRSKQQNTKPELSRKHQQQKSRRKRTTGSKNDEKKPEAFAMQKETEQVASRLASQLDK